MPAPKKILFVLPYPIGYAPSQRFRVEAFFPLLQDAGYRFRSQCFFDEKAWAVLYKKGSVLQKAAAVLKGFLRRLYLLLFVAWRYDFVFVHREATPLGPPVVEWVLAKVFRKKIIYDFDDAIWIANTTAENRIVGWVKATWKVKWICRWAYKVVGGNDFLRAYASQYNSRAFKIPTCVDAVRRHNRLKAPHSGKPTVGWTGSHSTLHYLDEVIPVLAQLQSQFDFRFLVISNKPPVLSLRNWTFLPWQEKTEVDDLLQMDVGIMPLKPDAWSEGKCGFKLIQYLALGIPAVASDVGVNRSIVEDNVSGFLARNPEQWVESLKQLLSSASLRTDMGRRGRKKIETSFSIQSQEKAFLSLFD